MKKQDFGVTSEMVKALLEVWEVDYTREGLMKRGEIYCLAADMVIGFYVGLMGEEFFLTSLKGMPQLWE